MHSWRPFVIGRSHGSITSRAFAFAAGCAIRRRSWSFALTKSLYRLRSSLSTSSPAAWRKNRSKFGIAITAMLDPLLWGAEILPGLSFPAGRSGTRFGLAASLRNALRRWRGGAASDQALALRGVRERGVHARADRLQVLSEPGHIGLELLDHRLERRDERRRVVRRQGAGLVPQRLDVVLELLEIGLDRRRGLLPVGDVGRSERVDVGDERLHRLLHPAQEGDPALLQCRQ